MKHSPDENRIEELLENLPPGTSGKLDSRLSNAPWTPRAVQRRRVIDAALVATLILTLFAVVTPQGRAFAQSIIRFFTPAQATSFPLPPQPGPAETDSPDSDKTNALMLYSSMAEAEAAVGFDADQFAVSPEGYVLRSIEANPALGIIMTRYTAVGGELILAQSLSGFPSSSWSEVPPAAIERVEIGGNEGEFAQGMFVVYPNADSAVWEPDAPVFRLRWKDGDRWFSLEKMGDTYPTEWLDKQAMIALAESLSR